MHEKSEKTRLVRPGEPGDEKDEKISYVTHQVFNNAMLAHNILGGSVVSSGFLGGTINYLCSILSADEVKELLTEMVGFVDQVHEDMEKALLMAQVEGMTPQ